MFVEASNLLKMNHIPVVSSGVGSNHRGLDFSVSSPNQPLLLYCLPFILVVLTIYYLHFIEQGLSECFRLKNLHQI